ncbi:hypothetical protein AND_009205 [Anopheles darlingi]|uniref:Uncharacterized protein n=1 Tax=Anopheles darlingi TaxID=43151 RepID=W5J8K7_ANODA|nr:hypothetical protein AND_009205 [Anopheles darlingi]
MSKCRWCGGRRDPASQQQPGKAMNRQENQWPSRGRDGFSSIDRSDRPQSGSVIYECGQRVVTRSVHANPVRPASQPASQVSDLPDCIWCAAKGVQQQQEEKEMAHLGRTRAFSSTIALDVAHQSMRDPFDDGNVIIIIIIIIIRRRRFRSDRETTDGPTDRPTDLCIGTDSSMF